MRGYMARYAPKVGAEGFLLRLDFLLDDADGVADLAVPKWPEESLYHARRFISKTQCSCNHMYTITPAPDMAYSKPDMFEEDLVFLVCCTTEEEVWVLGEACSGSKPFCRLDRRADGVCWLPPERGLESDCVGAFRFRVFEGVG